MMNPNDMIGEKCPRCESTIETFPALSRTTRGVDDISVYACSPCGNVEAMEDFSGRGALPQSKWPTSPALKDGYEAWNEVIAKFTNKTFKGMKGTE